MLVRGVNIVQQVPDTGRNALPSEQSARPRWVDHHVFGTDGLDRAVITTLFVSADGQVGGPHTVLSKGRQGEGAREQ